MCIVTDALAPADRCTRSNPTSDFNGQSRCRAAAAAAVAAAAATRAPPSSDDPTDDSDDDDDDDEADDDDDGDDDDDDDDGGSDDGAVVRFTRAKASTTASASTAPVLVTFTRSSKGGLPTVPAAAKALVLMRSGGWVAQL